MPIPPEFLAKKGLIIYILIFGSTGLGINNLYFSFTDDIDFKNKYGEFDVKLSTHVSDESSHTITDTKLDTIKNDIEDIKDYINDIEKNLQKLIIIACSNGQHNC